MVLRITNFHIDGEIIVLEISDHEKVIGYVNFWIEDLMPKLLSALIR